MQWDHTLISIGYVEKSHIAIVLSLSYITDHYTNLIFASNTSTGLDVITVCFWEHFCTTTKSPQHSSFLVGLSKFRLVSLRPLFCGITPARLKPGLFYTRKYKTEQTQKRPKNSTGWCEPPLVAIPCSSFSIENGHPKRIHFFKEYCTISQNFWENNSSSHPV